MEKSRSAHAAALFVAAIVALVLLAACAGGKTSGKTGSAATPSSGSGGAKGSTAVADTPSGAGLKPYTGSDDIIGNSNPGAKSVTLNIVGSQGNTASGFNFNGYANGDMVIRVPQGWKVSVNFSVDSALAHSLIVAPWSQRQAGSFSEAFRGAAIPSYSTGIRKGDPAAHFSFTADNASRYAIVCAVPGHDDLGMWDEFDVVAGLNKPEVLVK